MIYADVLAEGCEVTESGCWEWQRRLDNYGYAVHGTLRVAREAYRLMIGDVADDLKICHHCDNPKCVNPLHVFPGTHADNMRDAHRKGRMHSQRSPEERAEVLAARQRDMEAGKMVKFLLGVPGDHLLRWKEQAAEEGCELSEWMRQKCNNGLSKKRRKGLSEPIQRGRPKKQEGE